MKIVILGGGPGGYVAAIRAAQLGAEVTIVEKDKLGGTCLNRGCIPTKVLLYTSVEMENVNKEFKEIGIDIKGAEINWEKLQKRKETIVNRLVGGVQTLLRSNKVTKIAGEGSFVNSHQIKIKNDEGEIILYFDYAIIATGSAPVIIPLPGINLPGVITSDEVLALKEIPKSMAIIGGGVIGAEIASIYSSLGCKVSIVEMLPDIVSNMDQDIVKPLKDKLLKNGVKIYNNTKLESINNSNNGLQLNVSSASGKTTIQAEKVLLSIGRRPVTESLSLEKAGVTTEKGRVKVNKNMKTNIDNIYAVGDCTGGAMLAHVSSAQGIVAAEYIMNRKSQIDFKTIPYCVYTKPELAGVGLTEKQAKERGYAIKVGIAPMYINGKSIIEGDTDGIAKYIADADTGEILGLHISGPRATDLIVEGALAIRLEATIDEITSTIHAHPTVGEILHEAAHSAYGNAIHIPKK
ncbi:dihydrolipoyl dehydrogenase [Sedimentibacter sp.]|uniref:dihydrolipoyl dehydrogenase n=2 Tax=Sedimentibacter sp. TaxID=1960295 RepID=UPI0028B0AF20|nr:dihydrolipoyl dehydrogenase [Sedimentibacter sp.]